LTRINAPGTREDVHAHRDLLGSLEPAVICLEDCIAFCGLSEEEVLAIAEHEHIPEIAAAALAHYLLHQEHGAEIIRDMLRDDIRAALLRDDRQHARELFMALRHFLTHHPEAAIHPGFGRR
jgi:hypothetical protein